MGKILETLNALTTHTEFDLRIQTVCDDFFNKSLDGDPHTFQDKDAAVHIIASLISDSDATVYIMMSKFNAYLFERFEMWNSIIEHFDKKHNVIFHNTIENQTANHNNFDTIIKTVKEHSSRFLYIDKQHCPSVLDDYCGLLVFGDESYVKSYIKHGKLYYCGSNGDSTTIDGLDSFFENEYGFKLI